MSPGALVALVLLGNPNSWRLSLREHMEHPMKKWMTTGGYFPLQVMGKHLIFTSVSSPKSSKSLDHFSIECHGELGILNTNLEPKMDFGV